MIVGILFPRLLCSPQFLLLWFFVVAHMWGSWSCVTEITGGLYWPNYTCIVSHFRSGLLQVFRTVRASSNWSCVGMGVTISAAAESHHSRIWLLYGPGFGRLADGYG